MASLLLSSLGRGVMLEVSVVVVLQLNFVFPNVSAATFALHSSSTGWRSWSNAPALLLRRHPLRTIRPPPPTAVAELQWGESRSEAFGTGTRRRWVVLQSQCGRSCCPLWATVSTRRLIGGQSRLGTRLSGWRRGTRGQGGSGKPVVCRVLAVGRCSR